MAYYDDDRYRDEEGEFIFDPDQMSDEYGGEELEWLAQPESEHGDEELEWQAQPEPKPKPERTSSPVRKRLRKLSSISSHNNEVQQSSPQKSRSKQVGNKKRKPSKSAAAARQEREDMENHEDEHGDEELEWRAQPGDEELEWQAQPEPELTSSPVRKRLRKASSSSSHDDEVQQRHSSVKKSRSKQVGNKKRKPSKSSTAAAGQERKDEENDEDEPANVVHLEPLTGVDAAPGRDKVPDKDIPAQIERFIARLEVAAEEDAELNRQSMPAINKLRLLPALTQVMAKRPLHEEFLDRGILSVLKNWLEPLPDQSLPNATLRTALLDILTNLSIDTGDDERRQQLKKSGLGRVVMFLSKSDEETVANKRVARAMVDKWSRPLFQKPARLDEVDFRYMENSQKQNRKRARPQVSQPRSPCELESDDFDLEALQQQMAEESEARKASKPTMTQIPEPIPADFVIRPRSKIDAEEVRARAKVSKKEENRERLQKMARKHTPRRKPQGFKAAII